MWNARLRATGMGYNGGTTDELCCKHTTSVACLVRRFEKGNLKLTLPEKRLRFAHCSIPKRLRYNEDYTRPLMTMCSFFFDIRFKRLAMLQNICYAVYVVRNVHDKQGKCMLELLMEPLLTTEDVARRLNTSEASVRRWIRNGRMAGIQVGDQWRVERAELDDFIRRNRRPAKNDESQQV